MAEDTLTYLDGRITAINAATDFALSRVNTVESRVEFLESATQDWVQTNVARITDLHALKYEILHEVKEKLVDRIVEVLAEHFDFQRTPEDDAILEQKLREVLDF